MATALNIKAELLECSVCYEIFRNAHFLRCGHSFCKECIDQIMINNQLSCPTCREITSSDDVKKDYNICQLVEGLPANKSSEEKDIKTNDCCDICEDMDKNVTHYCQECTELMCQECTKAHKGSRVSQNHPILTLESFLDQLKAEIPGKVEQLHNLKLLVTHFSLMAKKEISNIKLTQQELCVDVDNYIDTCIQKLETHRVELKEEITKNDSDYLYELKLYMEEVNQIKDTIDKQLKDLNEQLKTHEVAMLKDISSNANIHIPDFPINDKDKCSLTTDVEIEPNSLLRLNKTHSKQAAGTYTKEVARRSQGEANYFGYNCLSGKQLEVVAQCGEYVEKICEVNGNIWVTNDGKGYIVVYSKSLNKLTEIKHEEISGVKGITTTDQSNVVVASRTGLHVINVNYTYSYKIASGSYHDVMYHKNMLYAINSSLECVQIFHGVNKESAWLKKKSYNISPKVDLGWENRILATDRNIIVSNVWNLHILYNFHGNTIDNIHIEQKLGTNPGQFNKAHLCGVDCNYSYIYCDYDNHRLQVCDQNWKHSVIQLPCGVKKPTNIYVEHNDRVIWLSATYNGKKSLLKLKYY